MTTPVAFDLLLSRHFNAPCERVFDAFVTAEAIRAWQCPRGMEVESASVDAQVGGSYRVAMRSRDGTRYALTGTFRRIERPHRLVYTWQWEPSGPMPGVPTLIEIDFVEAAGGGTDLRMRHSGFPAEAARVAHAQGWDSTLNRLNDFVDPQGSAGTLPLWGDARSSYTRTVRLACAEKGIAVGFVPSPPHSPPVDAVHPFGRIPVLRDGALEIWETSAIVRYLDEAFPGQSLTPQSLMGRMRCEQWVSAVNAYLYDTMVRRYVLATFFPRGADGTPDRGVIDTALREMPAQLDALERAYGQAGGDFLGGGSTPCHADLFIAPILVYVEALPEGAQLMSDRPRVRQAQAAMRRRASFLSTQPQAPSKETL